MGAKCTSAHALSGPLLRPVQLGCWQPRGARASELHPPCQRSVGLWLYRSPSVKTDSHYLVELHFLGYSHPYSQHVYMLESATPEAYACLTSTPNPWEALETC